MTVDWLVIVKDLGVPFTIAAFLAFLFARSLKQSGDQIDRLISVNQELVKANVAQDERLRELETSLKRVETQIFNVGSFDPGAIARLLALELAKPLIPPPPTRPSKRLRALKEGK